MPNGIGRVWVANSGDEGRPNGVGPVWIENISALGPGGGDIPSDVSGKWEDASDCVEANSGTWGQGTAGGDMSTSSLDYETLWDTEGNEFYTITGYDGSAFGMGGWYVDETYGDFHKNGGDSEISINDNEIRFINPEGGYSNQSGHYDGTSWSIGYDNNSARIEGTIFNGSPVISFRDENNTTANITISSINNWDSTYNTVSSNSASWASGNFSGVTVSNSLTGDGKNTPLGLNSPIVAQNNEATGSFNQYGNSFRNGDAYAEYGASNINLKVTGGSPYISAVSYDYNNDFLGSVSLNSTGVVFKDSMGGITQFGSAAVDSWVDTRSTVMSNSASWGQGTTYSAGTGILINNNEISVDTMTIPDYNSVTGMIDAATGNIPTPVNADWSATTGLAQILNKPQTEEITVSGIDAGSGISITTGTSAYSINCTYGEDINYISGVVGDVESLLASL